MTKLSLDQLNKDQANMEEISMQRLENKLDALFRSHNQLSSKVDQVIFSTLICDKVSNLHAIDNCSRCGYAFRIFVI